MDPRQNRQIDPATMKQLGEVICNSNCFRSLYDQAQSVANGRLGQRGERRGGRREECPNQPGQQGDQPENERRLLQFPANFWGSGIRALDMATGYLDQNHQYPAVRRAHLHNIDGREIAVVLNVHVPNGITIMVRFARDARSYAFAVEHFTYLNDESQLDQRINLLRDYFNINDVNRMGRPPSSRTTSDAKLYFICVIFSTTFEDRRRIHCSRL